MKTSVSVIIPVFNVEQYLRECLDSVVNQTLKDIEIICVNDGSMDNSLEILEEYARNDSRIRIINQINRGLSAARNVAVETANGEYILFLDSDDYIEKNTCELLYQKATMNNLDLLFFEAAAFYESEELHEKHRIKDTYYTRSKKYDAVYKGSELFTELIVNSDYIESACMQLIRKDYLNHPCWFYEGIKHEDVVFTCGALLGAERVSCIQDKLYRRRVRENSITTKKIDIKELYSFFICFKEVLFELAKNKLSSTERWAVCELVGRLRFRVVDIYLRLPEGERDSFLNYDNSYDNIYIFNNMIMPLIRDTDTLENLRRCKKEVNWLQSEKSRLENCVSYRIGRVITYIPRRVRRLIKKVRGQV